LALQWCKTVVNGYNWVRPSPNPVRVTVSGGCPPALHGRRGVTNPGLGSWFEMAPDHPAGGLVCEYRSASFGTPGSPDLLGHRTLRAAEAVQVASSADQASTTRHFGAVTCTAQGAPDYLIALRFRGRADTDLWYEAAGCGRLTNGRLLAFPGGLTLPEPATSPVPGSAAPLP